MSSEGLKVIKHAEFVDRLIDAFGTNKASVIKERLGISYQAVSNYLSKKRLPSAEILVLISDRTSCSIDWLLTGRGKKFRDLANAQGKPLATGQIETIAGRILVEVTIDEIGKQPVHLKTVKLQSSDVLSEKVLDPANALTGSKP